MEIKVQEIALPKAIVFNYEELKAELIEKALFYENLVYTDDQLKDAKADRAKLNKLKKAINDERLRLEREYMEPFNDFKKKVSEIISIIDRPVNLIDKQVKEFEEKKKADKKAEIQAYWDGLEDKPDWMSLKQIYEPEWLNAGTKMASIIDRIQGWLNRVSADLKTLQEMEDFSFEAVDEYKRSLDLNRAIAEGKRIADIQKRKRAEEEKKKAEEEARKMSENAVIHVDASEFMAKPVVEEAPAKRVEESEKSWIKFEALLDVKSALKLKEFFKSNGIEFRPIGG